MKKSFKILVLCLVAIFAISSCSSTKTTEPHLRIKGKTISFDLAEGKFVDGELQRAISESKKDEVLLPKAERAGYVFNGWLDASIDGASPVFSVISKEVKEAKLYTASWQIIEYKVNFVSKLVSGTTGDVKDLPKFIDTSYTVEMETTLEPLAAKPGYDFVGWIEEGAPESSATQTVQLQKGTTGDKTVIVLWKPSTYTINIDLDGGTLDAQVQNQYTYKSDAVIEVPNPVKEGYNFIGWTYAEAAVSEKKENSIILNTEYKGNIELKANWEIIEYPITYYEAGLVIEDLSVEEEKPPVENPANLPVADDTEKEVGNPDHYTVTEDVSFINPTREGFTFLGWVEKPEGYIDVSKLTADMVLPVTDFNYSIKVGTVGQKELVAIWSRNTHKVSYNLKGGTLEESNPTSFVYGEEGFELKAPSREFYVFKGWKDLETGVVYEESFDNTLQDRDITLTAQWKPIEYSITYNLDGGKFEGEYASSYTYETKTFSLPLPVRNGYTFTGWAGTEEVALDPVLFTLTFTIDGVDLTIRVYSNKTEWVFPLGMTDSMFNGIEKFLAKQFSKAEMSSNGNIITIYLTNMDSTAIEDYIKSLAYDAGIVFDYQKTQVSDVAYDNITIYQGSHGDKTFTATWQLNVYSIGYAQEEEYGLTRIEPEVVVYEYPTSYTAEEIVEIKNPEKIGFDFMGWVLEDQEYTEAKKDLVLDKGSVGDRVYVPLFKIHNYKVELDLGGGALVDAQTPASFTIVSTDFTVGAASRENYLFQGWLCEDGQIRNEVSVDCSKAQDVVLKALWKPVEYTISYDLSGGKYAVGSEENVAQYNVETEAFTLINPTKETYEFAGWMIKGQEDKQLPVVAYTFDTTNGGNVELVATWKAKEYKIYYLLGGGSFEYADSNPYTFTNFMEEFTLEAPQRSGYTFLGWVELGKEGYRPVVDYVIKAKQLRNDVYLKAVWQASTYSINYNLNGGYFSRGTTLNATSYTTEDRGFILSNPTRDGYEFLGWVRSEYSTTDKPSKVVRVDTSTGGNLSYDALWKADSYTITYNLDGGTYKYGNSNPSTYTTNSCFTLANPHKDGYTFLGWIQSGDPLESVRQSVTITPGTTGNLTFYAIYEQSLVAVGEVTKLQTQIIELGKNDIPRPDWVIKAPEDTNYHYEKAYASGGALINNLENASAKCREYFAAYLSTEVSSVSKSVNGVVYNTLSTEVATEVNRSELVEYWEDANGGVWVLMRIGK